MNPSTEQARYLASSLQDVAEGLSPDDLDGLLRVLDLGDRLRRMGEEAWSEAQVVELVQLAEQARPGLLGRIHELVPPGWEWPPLDELGDAMLLGEQSEATIAWGMALLRLANLLPELQPEPRRGARQVLQRAQDRLQLDPQAFLALVSLAAQRVEDEPLDAQPVPVRALVHGMLELPILVAEERRRLADRASAVRVPLRKPHPLRGAAMRSDTLDPSPPDAWRTLWQGEHFTLSFAERVQGQESNVLLSVVRSTAAPAELSLERRDSVVVQDRQGAALVVEVRLHEPAEWQALVDGDSELVVLLPDGQAVAISFERLAAP